MREPQGNHLHLFFIAIIKAPLPGPSTSLCDRPHVLSESRGRCVAGSKPKRTVCCTDKENRLATMHHTDTDICVLTCARAAEDSLTRYAEGLHYYMCHSCITSYLLNVV